MRPRGWQVTVDGVVCKKCWEAAYVKRALEFGVAGVDGMKPDAAKPVYQELRRHHRLAAIAANGLLEELRRSDVYMTEATLGQSMPKFDAKAVNGYAVVLKICPSLNTGTASAIERLVLQKYCGQNGSRIGERWHHTAKTLRYSSFPLVVRRQQILGLRSRLVRYQHKKSNTYRTRTEYLVNLPVGKNRYEFRLFVDNPIYEATLKKLVESFDLDKRIERAQKKQEAKGLSAEEQGELEKMKLQLSTLPLLGTAEFTFKKLKVKASERSQQKAILKSRSGKSQNKQFTHLHIKLVMDKPVAARPEASGTAVVRLSSASFLVAHRGESEVWRAPQDNLRQLGRSLERVRHEIERAKLFNQRTSDDMKFERRAGRSVDAGLLDRRHARAEKRENRIKNVLHDVAVSVAEWCVRSQVAHVEYWDDDRGFFGKSFCYYIFKQVLSGKLRERGVSMADMCSHAKEEADAEFEAVYSDNQKERERLGGQQVVRSARGRAAARSRSDDAADSEKTALVVAAVNINRLNK